MTVQVRIPTILRTYTAGAAEVTAAAGTLREVIAGLDAAYPGLGGRILDDSGQLRRFPSFPRWPAEHLTPCPAEPGGIPWSVREPRASAARHRSEILVLYGREDVNEG